MARLGPFEPRPRLAVALSGGADSSALTLLADAWCRDRGGTVLALIVDHGLRPDSAAEAALTAERCIALGIAVRQLLVAGLTPGPALAERARIARYGLLTQACADAGILHLLLGHHAADQAETVMMRALGNSADRGLAAMPVLVETTSLRLLRPLLGIEPAVLRELLTTMGAPWIEDPSNRDPRALRARLRRLRDGCGTQALSAAAAAAGRRRAADDSRIAALLAERVSIRQEGFAVLTPGPLPCDALSALLQTIGGLAYPPRSDRVAALAAEPRPATLAGVRLMPAGKLGPGILVVREPRAMAPPVPALTGAIWDRRFRLIACPGPPDATTLGPLGADAAAIRRDSNLPAAVLRTLPALRQGKSLVMVPHLHYPDGFAYERVRLILNPPRPLAGAPFFFMATAQ